MEGYKDVDLYTTTPYSEPSNKKINEVLSLGTKGSGHAGECETAMIMAIDPDLVKTDALHEDGQHRRESIPGLRLYKRFDQNTEHGGLGDPRPATAEMGEQIFQVAEDFLVEAIRKIYRDGRK